MSIRNNIQNIKSSIEDQCHASGRDDKTVNLIAVSKVQPDQRIDEALDAGQRIFGENRVQEATKRWQERRTKYKNLELHLIGGLQTNKVKDAVALFDYIHTVDREKLAKAIAKEIQAQNRDITCMIQVNTGKEPQKSGIMLHDFEKLYNTCTRTYKLNVQGLMCIPPINEDPEKHFKILHQLANEKNLPHLSMGMSGDYKQAITHGATYIRVGTAVFGKREYT